MAYQSVFDQVVISANGWGFFMKNPQLKRRLKGLLERITYFYIHNQCIYDDQIRLIDRSISCFKYKARLGDFWRIPFCFVKEKNQVFLVLGDVLRHDEAEMLHQSGGRVLREALDPLDLEKMLGDWEQLDKDYLQDPSCEESIVDIDSNYIHAYRSASWDFISRLNDNLDADLPWNLHPDQRNFCEMQGPILLKGSAGSGKTTVALYRLIQANRGVTTRSQAEKQLYLTYNKNLSNHAQDLYQTQASDIDVFPPQFITIDQLCRKFISNADQRFPQERKIEFYQFQKIPAFRQMKTIQQEMMWEEIRGVIKGSASLDWQSQSELTLQHYLALPSFETSLTLSDRKIIYKHFNKYKNYIRSNHYWDELDLAREALKELSASEIELYDVLIVDEVQDLTIFHIFMILKLCGNVGQLFLTGDVQQAIYPTRFDWNRVKDLIFEHLGHLTEHHLYHGQHGQTLYDMTINFRSPRPIVDFANRLAHWRHEVLRESYPTLRAIRDGDPIRLLTSAQVKSLRISDQLTHQMMIIVPDQSIAEEASQLFPSMSIFTIHQAKGLERNYVILWGFFFWSRLHWTKWSQSRSIPIPDEQAYRLRYLINLLNVATTRSINSLFIVDDWIPQSWPVLQEIPFVSNKLATEHLQTIFDLESTNEDYRLVGWEFEQREDYERAAQFYRVAHYEDNATRCLAKAAHRDREYLKAADLYDNSGLFLEGAICRGHHYLYQQQEAEAAYGYYADATLSPQVIASYMYQAGNYRLAIKSLLKVQHQSKQAHADLLNLLQDIDKMGSLDPIAAEIVNELIALPILDVDLQLKGLLHTYCSTRLAHTQQTYQATLSSLNRWQTRFRETAHLLDHLNDPHHNDEKKTRSQDTLTQFSDLATHNHTELVALQNLLKQIQQKYKDSEPQADQPTTVVGQPYDWQTWAIGFDEREKDLVDFQAQIKTLDATSQDVASGLSELWTAMQGLVLHIHMETILPNLIQSNYQSLKRTRKDYLQSIGLTKKLNTIIEQIEYLKDTYSNSLADFDNISNCFDAILDLTKRLKSGQGFEESVQAIEDIEYDLRTRARLVDSDPFSRSSLQEKLTQLDRSLQMLRHYLEWMSGKVTLREHEMGSSPLDNAERGILKVETFHRAYRRHGLGDPHLTIDLRVLMQGFKEIKRIVRNDATVSQDQRRPLDRLFQDAQTLMHMIAGSEIQATAAAASQGSSRPTQQTSILQFMLQLFDDERAMSRTLRQVYAAQIQAHRSLYVHILSEHQGLLPKLQALIDETGALQQSAEQLLFQTAHD